MLILGLLFTGTISHCLFELARHPDIQEQLYGDLKRALDKFAGNESSDEYYETIMNSISLLEAVIKETLRLYPPISMMSRICNTDGYRLGSLVLQKNDIVSIPTCKWRKNFVIYTSILFSIRCHSPEFRVLP